MKMNRPFVKVSFLLTILFLSIATTFKTDNGDPFEIAKNIEIYVNMYKELNTYYAEELDPGALMTTGIEAMLASLDPYTNYLKESDIEGYRFLTEGKYRGIGAKFEVIDGYITITEPYQESPAVKAGMKAGDQIIAVEGKSAVGKTPEEVDQIMKGAPGTDIEITVKRPGESKNIDLTLTRSEINVPNVPYYGMVNEDIGYISLTTFTREAGRNVGNALRELKKENPDIKGVIFDLRDNGGGLLNEAVNICNLFIPKGELVVSTRGKVKEWDRTFRTIAAPVDLEIPLVVLINKRSASASEIVSGVMQDLDRGVLLGQRSFGKGLVQNTRDIGYNARLKLTTAKYYIPSERCIQGVEYENGEPVDIPEEKRARFKTRNGRTVLDGGGVKPDVVVKLPYEAAVVKALKDQFLIFKYVNEYTIGRDSIKNLKDFQFDDWAGFKQFLVKNNFTYETDSESYIVKIKEFSEKEGYEVASTISSLQSAVEQAKEQDLDRNKSHIVKLIESEIASRYEYQVGKIKMSLRNDAEIEEAIELLNDQERYKEILQPRE
jgi:carboxyl-terminal processing protease